MKTQRKDKYKKPRLIEKHKEGMNIRNPDAPLVGHVAATFPPTTTNSSAR